MAAVLTSLDPLVQSLRSAGYTVVGPTVRNGSIVLAELNSADDLPYGVGVTTAPGSYRLTRRDDRAAFAHSAGPQSFKQFLHPPREALVSIEKGKDGGLSFAGPAPEQPKYAFLGVRSCDLRAIAVQDRILGLGSGYSARRGQAFLVAVNCGEPSAVCFCVSAGGGPDAASTGAAYDLALTELVTDGSDPRYLASAGSDAGREVLAALPQLPATPDAHARARAVVTAATGKMQRSLPGVDLHQMLAATLEAARWDDVAARCLACANCTMVCPTCFCTTVTDVTDLTGDHAERWQNWASCFEVEYSYIHGGAARTSIRGRYRQWLTHKLGTWHDQFGESGCVGCGRCIAWCPVGIDITEEANALAAESGAPNLLAAGASAAGKRAGAA